MSSTDGQRGPRRGRSGDDDGPQGLSWSSLLSIGAVSAVMLAAGLALGWWIDSLLSTSPIFVLVGIAVGIAAGFSYTFVQFRNVLKE